MAQYVDPGSVHVQPRIPHSDKSTGRLAGKVAVITGGGSGIGLATAILFAQEGARVVVANRTAALGEEAAGLCRQAGGEACFVQTDVSVAEDCERLMRVAVERYGGLDILFNNAGLNIGGDAVALNVEDWDRVIRTDLTGEFMCTRAAVPWMRQRGGGAIVNMASPHGFRTGDRTIAYATAKGAVLAMTKSMALDLAQDQIRVNRILPGTIDTALGVGRLPPEDKPLHIRRFADVHPFGRMGETE